VFKLFSGSDFKLECVTIRGIGSWDGPNRQVGRGKLIFVLLLIFQYELRNEGHLLTYKKPLLLQNCWKKFIIIL